MLRQRGPLLALPRQSATISMLSKYNLNAWNTANFPKLSQYCDGIRSRSPVQIPAGANFGSYLVSSHLPRQRASKSVQLAKRGFGKSRPVRLWMSRNFSPDLIVIKILEKIKILFSYYIKLLQKVLGVALGISATFRTRQFWCLCAHSANGRFLTPVAFVQAPEAGICSRPSNPPILGRLERGLVEQPTLMQALRRLSGCFRRCSSSPTRYQLLGSRGLTLRL